MFSTPELIAERPDAPGAFLALAPMDGVTDGSYREVLTGLFGGRSGISVCVSEFVRVLRQPVPAAVLLRHCPELARGGRTSAGVPVFVQLLGGEPRWMAEAAARAAELGAPGIDLNFGCPAKTVNNSDGGATLLKQPCRVEEVTRAVREAVPDAIPVTAKVRIGWEDARAMVDIARAAEAGGASWLTIHARTRAQLYKPPVDWGAIGRARAAVGIPVVANGDLFDLDALRACHEVSGCEAFMIGRGAMGRPELFAQARGWRGEALTSEEMVGLLRRYVEQLIADGGQPKGALNRLKQWLRMGAMLRGDVAAWFEVIKRLQTLEEALGVLHRPQQRHHSSRALPIALGEG
ncbi:MAG: tRNA-dihydrouridine synthase family protein [Enhygromyxa sp.]